MPRPMWWILKTNPEQAAAAINAWAAEATNNRIPSVINAETA